MRLPPAMKAVLSKLARQRTTDATILALIWLAERLERGPQIKKTFDPSILPGHLAEPQYAVLENK